MHHDAVANAVNNVNPEAGERVRLHGRILVGVKVTQSTVDFIIYTWV